MKIGIDTNIFIDLFESAETLNKLKEEGHEIYTHPGCLWEICKYVKTLELKNKNTEEVVMNFMKRNGIFFSEEEVEEDEIKEFEEKCRKAGIDCHSPDSKFILAFKKEEIEKVYSEDRNFRKAAEVAGMIAPRFSSLDDEGKEFRRR